jgi:Cu/Ag efflux protein CusF
MTMKKIALASVAALGLISSVALAQQTMTGTGMVTIIDRIHGMIAIKQIQSGTVGTNTAGAVTEFRLTGASLDALHAGDRVTFSATESGGMRTITKIEKQ